MSHEQSITNSASLVQSHKGNKTVTVYDLRTACWREKLAGAK